MASKLYNLELKPVLVALVPLKLHYTKSFIAANVAEPSSQIQLPSCFTPTTHYLHRNLILILYQFNVLLLAPFLISTNLMLDGNKKTIKYCGSREYFNQNTRLHCV